MASRDRALLVWICDQYDIVRMEQVTLSKDGLGYHINGTLWRRMPLSEMCKDVKGNRIRIVPVSKYEVPEWVESKGYEFSSDAKLRYQRWIDGDLSHHKSVY